MFGELPAWGFYVRHAKNVTFENVKISTVKPDYRAAFVFDDVQSPVLDRVAIFSEGDTPVIVTKDVTDITFVETKRTDESREWLRDVSDRKKSE